MICVCGGAGVVEEKAKEHSTYSLYRSGALYMFTGWREK